MAQRVCSAKLPVLVLIGLFAVTGVCSAAQVTLVTGGDFPITFSQPGTSDPLVQSLVGQIISNITSARGGSVALLDSTGPALGDLLGFISLVNQANIIVVPDPAPSRGGGGGGGGGFSSNALKVAMVSTLPETTFSGGDLGDFESFDTPAPRIATLLGVGALGLVVVHWARRSRRVRGAFAG